MGCRYFNTSQAAQTFQFHWSFRQRFFWRITAQQQNTAPVLDSPSVSATKGTVLTRRRNHIRALLIRKCLCTSKSFIALPERDTADEAHTEHADCPTWYPKPNVSRKHTFKNNVPAHDGAQAIVFKIQVQRPAPSSRLHQMSSSCHAVVLVLTLHVTRIPAQSVDNPCGGHTGTQKRPASRTSVFPSSVSFHSLFYVMWPLLLGSSAGETGVVNSKTLSIFALLSAHWVTWRTPWSSLSVSFPPPPSWEVSNKPCIPSVSRIHSSTAVFKVALHRPTPLHPSAPSYVFKLQRRSPRWSTHLARV
jgi:hypothetical protein